MPALLRRGRHAVSRQRPGQFTIELWMGSAKLPRRSIGDFSSISEFTTKLPVIGVAR